MLRSLHPLAGQAVMMFTLDAAVKLPLVVRGQVSSRPAKKIRSIARVCS